MEMSELASEQRVLRDCLQAAYSASRVRQTLNCGEAQPGVRRGVKSGSNFEWTSDG